MILTKYIKEKFQTKNQVDKIISQTKIEKNIKQTDEKAKEDSLAAENKTE